MPKIWKLTLKLIQEIVESRGGKCLSDTYVNNHTKMEFGCSKGHRWWTTAENIRRGHWCPHCAGCAKHTIEEIQELSKSRDGKCLSEEYVNAHTKLLWECGEGHQWWSTPDSVRVGHWCRICARLEPLTIEEMQELAESRGGKCLSTQYVNNHTKLLWECEEGHTWEAIPNAIKDLGQWCPRCLHKSEQECREIFESIFGEEFPTKRPDWLINQKTNRKLELDGYNGRDVAFEYNGEQHYEEVEWFRHDEESLKDQKQIDALKVKLCKENGVTLIVIPHTVDDKYDFIVNELVRC